MATTVSKAWEVESPRGAIYTVLLYKDGSTSCDCPGWVFQKKGKPRGCKHTREVGIGRALFGWREITNHPDVNGPTVLRVWKLESMPGGTVEITIKNSDGSTSSSNWPNWRPWKLESVPSGTVTIKKFSDGSFTCSCGWPKCSHIKDAKAADRIKSKQEAQDDKATDRVKSKQEAQGSVLKMGRKAAVQGDNDG